MRELKDTPLGMPLRIFSPRRLADFPWAVIVAWYIVAALVTSFEPDPSGMGIRFHWTYVLQAQFVGLAARLAIPLLFLPLAPALPLRRYLGLSLAACTIWLWTSPVAWLWSTPAGGIVLAIVRELGWLAILFAGAGFRRPASGLPRYLTLPAAAVLGMILSIGFQTIPDLLGSGGLRMDNIGSGRIAKGAPELPSGMVLRARWVLHGSDNILQPERLALGQRQTILSSRPGSLEVLVAPGAVPPPSDTTGSRRPDPSEGTALDRLLLGIPADTPDSLKLLMLHRAVHGAIRYDRKYFPGNSEQILKRGTGDCKAYAHLMTEGARRLGLRAKEVRGLLASPDGYYAHAWTSVELGGRWTDWDATSSIPFPDARYLRFSTPERATGAFDGELGIFTLEAIEFKALETSP
jgi:hypothetical protein